MNGLSVTCVDRHVRIEVASELDVRDAIVAAKDVQRDAKYVPHRLTITSGGTIVAEYQDVMKA